MVSALSFHDLIQAHQPKVYSCSCASDAQDAQEAQDVNSHS